MKALLFASLFLFATGPQTAQAGSLERGYQACLAFLKASPQQQRAIARRTGYSHAKVLEGCRYQKRVGLAGMKRGVKEYERAKHAGRGGQTQGGGSWQAPAPTPAPEPEPAPRSCWVASQGYGCTSGGSVSTSGCNITCTGGKTPSCWQGSVELNSCQVVQEDRCSCY